jgi:hypothetical protein
MVSFRYEQCPRSSATDRTAIYKFDHQPISDGMWHQLNRDTRSFYRFGPAYFQFITPEDHWSESEVDEVLELIEQAGPLQTDDELEILISEIDSGYRMMSEWVFQSAASAFEVFESRDWNAAYEELKRLKDEA